MKLRPHIEEPYGVVMFTDDIVSIAAIRQLGEPPSWTYEIRFREPNLGFFMPSHQGEIFRTRKLAGEYAIRRWKEFKNYYMEHPFT